MKLRVARSAIVDLDGIWAYVAQNQSLEAAERLLNVITSRFSVPAKNPGMGRNRSELREGLRSFPVGSYRIYYRPERSGIVRILHIRHAARDEMKPPGE